MTERTVPQANLKPGRSGAPTQPPAAVPPPDETPPPVIVLPPQQTLVRVSSNQPSFREVEFKPGFNVILAERTKDATKKDSRNGLGKSTLIEIISFCLGSKGKRG